MFGLSPLACQFVSEKTLNKLRTPTGDVFFNKVIETKRVVGRSTRILGFDMALYGLFWITWWFFWSAKEGGEEEFELYGVRWAPLTTDFVRDGPFKWLRYPLAFGWLEFLWGLGFLVQSTTVVLKVVPVLAVVVVIYLLVVVERRKLGAHGLEYRQYRNVAPLIVPRIPSSAAILNLFRRRRRR